MHDRYPMPAAERRRVKLAAALRYRLHGLLPPRRRRQAPLRARALGRYFAVRRRPMIIAPEPLSGLIPRFLREQCQVAVSKPTRAITSAETAIAKCFGGTLILAFIVHSEHADSFIIGRAGNTRELVT